MCVCGKEEEQSRKKENKAFLCVAHVALGYTMRVGEPLMRDVWCVMCLLQKKDAPTIDESMMSTFTIVFFFFLAPQQACFAHQMLMHIFTFSRGKPLSLSLSEVKKRQVSGEERSIQMTLNAHVCMYERICMSRKHSRPSLLPLPPVHAPLLDLREIISVGEKKTCLFLLGAHPLCGLSLFL